jgi:hypothetical protein
VSTPTGPGQATDPASAPAVAKAPKPAVAPSDGSAPRPAPENAGNDLPAGNEAFVQEELPSDFWGEEQAEPPPSTVSTRSDVPATSPSPSAASASVGRGNDVPPRPPRDSERPPSPAGPSPEATQDDGANDEARRIEGEAFAMLQRLFPGRVVSIEAPAAEDDGAEAEVPVIGADELAGEGSPDDPLEA